MATTNIFKRIATRKKNPDWARVEEPDTIVRPMVFTFIALIITAFSMLTAWRLMTASPIDSIAYFLASFHSTLPFDQVYAAFASALIALINLVVLILFTFLSPADNDDVIEMISDLDSNVQERIVELENTLTEKIDAISRNE